MLSVCYSTEGWDVITSLCIKYTVLHVIIDLCDTLMVSGDGNFTSRSFNIFSASFGKKKLYT